MDLNYILIWIVGVSAAITLVRLTRMGARLYCDWIFVNGVLLSLLGVGLIFFPDWVGYAAGVAWALFTLAPSFGRRVVWRWGMQQQYAAAWRLALVLRWLHPFDVDRHRPSLLRAMWLAQRGQTEKAVEILRCLVPRGGATGRAAAAQLYRMTGRWEELVEWVDNSVGMSGLLRDVGVLLSYVRSLGETGNLERMLWVYAQYGGALEQSGHRPSRNLCRMMMMAFCGRTAVLEGLLSESLDWLPVTTQEFWRATAEAAAGETEMSRQRLTRLLEWETDAMARAAIERRLSVPIKVATETMVESVLEETQELRAAFAWRTAHATQAIIGMNVAMFALETFIGGSENEMVLLKLGAVSSAAVAAGDWWRLLAAMFLHYGWLHLTMNMLGLLLLGPFVEKSLGRVKFVATYLFSGLVSMAFVASVTHWRQMGDELLVGASGSIMGLVGATAIVWLRNWQTGRSHVALQRLRRVGLVIALQMVFDLVTPQVSMAAHTSGVITGCVVALLLTAGDG